MPNTNKISTCSPPKNNCRFFVAVKLSTRHLKEYCLFGAPMPGRSFNSNATRYGFGGKEKDDEIKGSGNSYDFVNRIYDSRLGKWLSVDPHQVSYPSLSPYNFAANNPIFYVDEDGRDITPSDAFKSSTFGAVHNYLIKNNEGYKSLVGKYADNKKFNLNLGTDDSKITPGKGATTKYKYTWASPPGNAKLKVTTTANSSENFSSSNGSEASTLYHFYIVIHEGAHSAEALNPTLASQSANHNAVASQINTISKAFKQLSTDLGLGLTDTQIKEVSLYGSEDSKAYKSYISGLATKNKTTTEVESEAFKGRVQGVLDQTVAVPKDATPVPAEKKEGK